MREQFNNLGEIFCREDSPPSAPGSLVIWITS